MTLLNHNKTDAFDQYINGYSHINLAGSQENLIYHTLACRVVQSLSECHYAYANEWILQLLAHNNLKKGYSNVTTWKLMCLTKTTDL